MPSDKLDRLVVQVDATSFTPRAVYSGVTVAARNAGVSRQAMHEALSDGTVCASYRWLRASIYDCHAALHNGIRIEDFLYLKPVIA